MALIYRWLEKPPSGKREILKAGVEWRNTHPGESRRSLKTALAAQFDIEIKDYWIDLIMDNTTDIPRSRGGRSDPP